MSLSWRSRACIMTELRWSWCQQPASELRASSCSSSKPACLFHSHSSVLLSTCATQGLAPFCTCLPHSCQDSLALLSLHVQLWRCQGKACLSQAGLTSVLTMVRGWPGPAPALPDQAAVHRAAQECSRAVQPFAHPQAGTIESKLTHSVQTTQTTDAQVHEHVHACMHPSLRSARRPVCGHLAGRGP